MTDFQALTCDYDNTLADGDRVALDLATHEPHGAAVRQ